MEKYTLYLGLTTKDKKTHFNFNESMTTINDILKDYCIDGATFIKSCGVWLSKFEDTLKIELININIEQDIYLKIVQGICRTLKTEFKQDCVLYTCQKIDGDFI